MPSKCLPARSTLVNKRSHLQLQALDAAKGMVRFCVQIIVCINVCERALVSYLHFCQSLDPPLVLTQQLYLHLHNPPILHRDFKSPNLLVGQHFEVKVWHLHVVLQEGAHSIRACVFCCNCIDQMAGRSESASAAPNVLPARVALHVAASNIGGWLRCRCVTSTSPRCWRRAWCPATQPPQIHGQCCPAG